MSCTPEGSATTTRARSEEGEEGEEEEEEEEPEGLYGDAGGDDDDDESDGDGDSDGVGRSELDEKNARMRAKIEKLEAAAVGEKPWQLKGEVGGKARPLNSLLETTLEFDQAGRPPPAVTEEATRGIDDIIRQRVKDGLWDDPVRKAALAPSAHRPKRVEISQEKSKLGLADEYAQQYEREVLGHKASDELAPKHAEVRKVFAKLVAKLDQLTSFQYAPKPQRQRWK